MKIDCPTCKGVWPRMHCPDCNGRGEIHFLPSNENPPRLYIGDRLVWRDAKRKYGHRIVQVREIYPDSGSRQIVYASGPRLGAFRVLWPLGMDREQLFRFFYVVRR